MRHFILVLFITLSACSFGQTGSINDKIIHASIEEPAPVVKRKLLSFKKRSSYFNPMNYLGAGLLYVYQNIFSEQIQADCAFELSCSEYTKLSIREHGFFTGTLQGFNQLSECAPNARYEHPPLFINSEGKIINRIEKAGK
jgi:uncharacterized protein